MTTSRPRPLVLAVLDGVGVAPPSDGNAVTAASMPHLASLSAGLSTTLLASGAAVGLPEGAFGEGSAGLGTLVGGRALPTARARIDSAIAANQLGRNPELDQLMQIALYDGCPLHVVGLVSSAGVHACTDHLLAIVDLAAFHGIPVIVHAILDGVDTSPKGALLELDRLQLHLEGKNAVIGTVAGRHYALDTDERWERVQLAFQAIVRDNVLGPVAPSAATALDALQLAYGQGLTDAYVEPTRIGDYRGFRGDFVCDFTGQPPVWEWNGEDCGIVVLHRGDGPAALTRLLAHEGLPGEVTRDVLMDRHHPVRAFREHCLLTLAPTVPPLSLPVAFPSEPLDDSLFEVLQASGRRVRVLAESDRRPLFQALSTRLAAQVQEKLSFEFVPSPRLVERYDEKPELHVARVVARAVAALEAGEDDVVVVHLGNAERVAGTHDRAATARALEALDAALGTLAEATGRAGGCLAVTSDHGGCEELVDSRGRPKGPHSTNPVPFLLRGAELDGVTLRAGGTLADVAPTLLDVLGIAPPPAMTGRTLLLRG